MSIDIVGRSCSGGQFLFVGSHQYRAISLEAVSWQSLQQISAAMQHTLHLISPKREPLIKLYSKMRNMVQMQPRDRLPFVSAKKLPDTPQNTDNSGLTQQASVFLVRNSRVQEIYSSLCGSIFLHYRRPSVLRRKLLVANTKDIPNSCTFSIFRTGFLDSSVVTVVEVKFSCSSYSVA